MLVSAYPLATVVKRITAKFVTSRNRSISAISTQNSRNAGSDPLYDLWGEITTQNPVLSERKFLLQRPVYHRTKGPTKRIAEGSITIFQTLNSQRSSHDSKCNRGHRLEGFGVNINPDCTALILADWDAGCRMPGVTQISVVCKIPAISKASHRTRSRTRCCDIYALTVRI